MAKPGAYKLVNLAEWPRAGLFDLFRDYQKPHYAITSRLDISALIARHGRDKSFSTYRACLYAIGTAIHAVPELKMRFRGDEVRQYDHVRLSVTVPNKRGSYNYAYLSFEPDYPTFDKATDTILKEVAEQSELGANDGVQDDLVFCSCVPWIDYTSISNVIARQDDSIPRVNWGRFSEKPGGDWDMAMTLEVHHALVDGAQVAAYLEAVQETLSSF
ncbi:MAG: CatA-like O-acetyltransferase [Pseudomonadota bacterium]